MSWTLRTLIEAAGLDAAVDGNAEVTGLEHDSRRVRAGDLFCCVPGRVTDGHEHAAAAVAAGASALLVERTVAAAAAQARVDRVRAALGPLAHAFYGRPSEAVPVTGVTGTNGKTTVTYLLEAITSAAGSVPGVIGTVERRGPGFAEPAPRNTPEATELHALLARMRDVGCDVIVMEVTSDGLAQDRVSATRFACVAFTNLTQDHLETHGTMEAYFEAKARLFDPVFSDRAVINVRDPSGVRLLDLAAGMDLMTYGAEGADITAEDAAITPDGIRATLRTPSGDIDVVSSLVGAYNLENIECATGMALALGYGPDAVAAGVAALKAVPGRLDRVDGGQDFLVLVDYAHTPDALTQALGACRKLTGGRLIVVFGCGGDRDRGKRPLMGEAATRCADLAVLTSDNPRSEDPLAILAEIEQGALVGGGAYEIEPDRRAAIGMALQRAGTGDVVLIAGKGHETGQTARGTTAPFDDRVVAREILEELSCRS